MVGRLILTQKTMAQFRHRLLCTCLMDRKRSPKPPTRVRFLPGVLRFGEMVNTKSFDLFICGFDPRKRRFFGIFLCISFFYFIFLMQLIVYLKEEKI